MNYDAIYWRHMWGSANHGYSRDLIATTLCALLIISEEAEQGAYSQLEDWEEE